MNLASVSISRVMSWITVPSRNFPDEMGHGTSLCSPPTPPTSMSWNRHFSPSSALRSKLFAASPDLTKLAMLQVSQSTCGTWQTVRSQLLRSSIPSKMLTHLQLRIAPFITAVWAYPKFVGDRCYSWILALGKDGFCRNPESIPPSMLKFYTTLGLIH